MPTPEKPMPDSQRVVDWIDKHCEGLMPTPEKSLTEWQRQLVEQVFDPSVKSSMLVMPKRSGRRSLNREIERALAAFVPR